jgi:hypothetical protein
MSCKHFAERWDDFLAGALSDVEYRAAAAHLSGCAACGELVATLRDTLAALPAAAATVPPADLADAVLAHTSGATCGAAQALLCDFVDDVLAAADRVLVETHVAHCARCTALCTTLQWLATALPSMAALDPGAAFTRRVVAATTQGPAQPAPWRVALAERWRHMLARPRFAWEAAYVGLLLLVALFGTSISPFRDVPPRALAVVQVDPREAVRGAGSQARTLHGGIGSASQRMWDFTGGAMGRRFAALADAYADRHPGMHEAYGNMQLHSGELRQRCADRNFAAASVSLHALRGDLRALWKSGSSAPPATPP